MSEKEGMHQKLSGGSRRSAKQKTATQLQLNRQHSQGGGCNPFTASIDEEEEQEEDYRL